MLTDSQIDSSGGMACSSSSFFQSSESVLEDRKLSNDVITVKTPGSPVIVEILGVRSGLNRARA
jgi:hypothetical protein